MPPEIQRIDLVQGDAKVLEFHAFRQHPTAGPTALPSLAAATAMLIMRHQQATLVRASLPGSVYNASLGLVHVRVGTLQSATAGQYRAQLVLDFGPAVGVETVPADEPYLVVIRERV